MGDSFREALPFAALAAAPVGLAALAPAAAAASSTAALGAGGLGAAAAPGPLMAAMNGPALGAAAAMPVSGGLGAASGLGPLAAATNAAPSAFGALAGSQGASVPLMAAMTGQPLPALGQAALGPGSGVGPLAAFGNAPLLSEAAAAPGGALDMDLLMQLAKFMPQQGQGQDSRWLPPPPQVPPRVPSAPFSATDIMRRGPVLWR